MISSVWDLSGSCRHKVGHLKGAICKNLGSKYFLDHQQKLDVENAASQIFKAHGVPF